MFHIIGVGRRLVSDSEMSFRDNDTNTRIGDTCNAKRLNFKIIDNINSIST